MCSLGSGVWCVLGLVEGEWGVGWGAVGVQYCNGMWCEGYSAVLCSSLHHHSTVLAHNTVYK